MSVFAICAEGARPKGDRWERWPVDPAGSAAADARLVAGVGVRMLAVLSDNGATFAVRLDGVDTAAEADMIAELACAARSPIDLLRRAATLAQAAADSPTRAAVRLFLNEWSLDDWPAIDEATSANVALLRSVTAQWAGASPDLVVSEAEAIERGLL